MATIKAGTYKIDKLLTNISGRLTINVNFTCSLYHPYFGDMTLECSAIVVGSTVKETASLDYHIESASVDLSAIGVTLPLDYNVCSPFDNPNWLTFEYGSGVETIVITEDTVVDDTAADWFDSNVKPQGGSSDTPAPTPATAAITYNGATIAALGGGQSATLKCAGMMMESDVVVEVAQMPEGGGESEPDTRFKQLIERTITEISDDTVTSIGEYAFYNCSNLTSADLPSVTNIESYAFQHCSNLTSINLPSAKSIGSTVFLNCSNLTSADLPNATSIGQYAFNNCSNLTSVNLSSAKSIGSSAFINCSKLTTLILRNSTACALLNTNTFKSTPFASGNAGGTLLVPRALVESYKTATNWSVIWGYGHNQFLALEDYTVDGTTTGAIDWDKLNGGAA